MTDSTASRPWLDAYSPGVPADIDVAQYQSLTHLLEDSFQRYAARPAYSFMGKEISYAQVDTLSQAFAAYLQGLGLVKGDRVALMMPNVPQYPVAVAAILRAGFVVVNLNPSRRRRAPKTWGTIQAQKSLTPAQSTLPARPTCPIRSGCSRAA